jgi:preprotein translocase subunit SecA
MLENIFRKFNSKETNNYLNLVDLINQYNFKDYSDQQLKNLISNYKEQYKAFAPNFDLSDKKKPKEQHLQELLTECFAITKEICSRSLGLNPFNTQLLAGVALHFGKIVEMQTGEGKTLAAVFPVVFNALAGKGVHVFTFNDYLAKRDTCWMGPVYEFWGLEARYINEGMTRDERKSAYRADIVYITPKEAGFDFLRDSLAYNVSELVHRPFNFVIIDEADSILIDEARIPLVIAGHLSSQHNQVNYFKKIVQLTQNYRRGIDYNSDENARNAYPTDIGIDRLERAMGCGNLFLKENLEILTALNNVIHAKALLKRDVDYIVRDGKIEIIDEFTGRVAENRKWPEGLQDAVEAIEGIEKEQKGKILGSITMQNFISQYPRMAGMTATAKSSAEELLETYSKEVFQVEPHKKCIRKDQPDRVFTHKEAKYNAVIEEILLMNMTKRPVLIGTSSVEESDYLAARLKNHGLDCTVLNAKNDEQEAAIIAEAGKLGSITVSTNMAGRGVDIRLGGGDPKEAEAVAALGGLYVIGINKNESMRIDSQLRGRAGRQGDPGESRFFISMEDDLLNKFGLSKELPQKYIGLRQDNAIDDDKLVSLINHIQRVVNGQNFDIRRTLEKYAYVLECQRQIIYKKRYKVLAGEFSSLISQKKPDEYERLCTAYGEQKVKEVERIVTLGVIDKGWFDFLDYCEYFKEGIHLVSVTRKSPIDEYRKSVIEAFAGMIEEIQKNILLEVDAIDFDDPEACFARRGLHAPSATWTYLVSDNYKQNKFSWLFGWNQ